MSKTTEALAGEADDYADSMLGKGEFHPNWHEVRDARFEALVRADERERCALISGDMDYSPDGAIAAAIRSTPPAPTGK